MLSSKRLLKERNNKLKINSFMINSAKKYNSLTDEEEEKKSVKDMNKDFTSRNNINNKRKINHFFINRYTKTAMLNNLFQKYTSINTSTKNKKEEKGKKEDDEEEEGTKKGKGKGKNKKNKKGKKKDESDEEKEKEHEKENKEVIKMKK